MSCEHDIMGRSNRHFIHANLEKGLAFLFFFLKFIFQKSTQTKLSLLYFWDEQDYSIGHLIFERLTFIKEIMLNIPNL